MDSFLMKLKSTKQYHDLLADLTPLVEKIKASEKAQEILKACLGDMTRERERIAKLTEMLRPGLKQKLISESDTLQKAFMFLGFFEAAVKNIIDSFLMILIANHHDFYVYSNRKYSSTFDSLDYAFLSEKIAFLKHHNFDIIPKEFQKFRNKIAHMDFEIRPKGIVVIEKKKYDLSKEILKLATWAIILGTALSESGFFELVEKTK